MFALNPQTRYELYLSNDTRSGVYDGPSPDAYWPKGVDAELPCDDNSARCDLSCPALDDVVLRVMRRADA